MSISICAPPALEVRIRWSDCPSCLKLNGKRRSPSTILTYEWYGPTETCLRCGDTWHSGEMAPRPARRGWRREAIDLAKRRYRHAHPKREVR